MCILKAEDLCNSDALHTLRFELCLMCLDPVMKCLDAPLITCKSSFSLRLDFASATCSRRRRHIFLIVKSPTHPFTPFPILRGRLNQREGRRHLPPRLVLCLCKRYRGAAGDLQELECIVLAESPHHSFFNFAFVRLHERQRMGCRRFVRRDLSPPTVGKRRTISVTPFS